MKTGIALIDDINTTKVEHGNLAFWWIGQLSYIVKTASAVLYFDPFLSEHDGRQVPPLLEPRKVTNATLIFGSHDHADHIDHPALPGIMAASTLAHLFVPGIAEPALLGEGLPAKRLHKIDNGESIVLNGIKVTGVAAAHELLDYCETSGYPYLGFIVEADGVTIYHSGDTCIYEGMATTLKKWDITIAFLPINGRDARRYQNNIIGNMTYQEAVDLAGSIRPKLTVPGHYEMFARNSEDPKLFADYMDVKYPKLKYWIGEHGEKVLVECEKK